jgi:hypothetical protein
VFFVSELKIAKSKVRKVRKVNFELNKLSNSQANTNTNK